MTLPDERTLAKYMHLMRQAIVLARSRAYSTDPQIADLLDAIENLPDLLTRWPECDEAIVAADLAAVEKRYPEWRGRLTGALRGPPSDSTR
jgi:hypothetical protein